MLHFQVKMLTKELELVRVSGERTKDELEGTETAIRDLEKQLKQKEWELTDEKNMDRAKVAELEAEMEQLRSEMSKSQKRFEHKHAELDQYAREKDYRPLLQLQKRYAFVREKISMQLRLLLVSEWLVDVFVEAILFSYNTPHTSLHYPPNPPYPKTKYRVKGSII